MVLTLLVGVPALGQQGQDSGWPQSRGDGLQSSRSDVSGPSHLSAKWIRDEIGDHFYVGGTAGGTNVGSDYFMQLDGEGHLLAATSRRNPREDDEFATALLAFDVDTGETAYAIDDADIECKPAVSQSVLWSLIEIAGADDPDRRDDDMEDASFALVGFDPADGEPISPPLRWSGTDQSPLSRCHFAFGLQVAADGSLLFAEWEDAHQEDEPNEHEGQMLTNFLVSDSGIAPRWSTELSDCGPADDFVLAPPAGAPHADHVYILQYAMDDEHECVEDADGNNVLQVWTLELASGNVVSKADLPGRQFTYVRGNLADDDGGIVVTTWTDRGDVGHLMRLVDDGTGQLLQAWAIDEPRDKDACDADVCRIPRGMAADGDRLLGVVGDQVLSIDLDDGNLQWRYELTTGPAIGDIVMDGDGTAYVESSTGPTYVGSRGRGVNVEAVTASGTRKAFLPPRQSLAVGNARVLGPIGDDGTIFGWASEQHWFALDTGPEACPEEVPPAGFEDTRGNTHERNIDCVVWWEIARGTSDDTYEPGKPVTRAQMATFLTNLITQAGGQLPDDPDDRFDDDDGTFHEHNINRLAETGVVSGTGRGTYSPHRRVDRAQMATFLTRAYLHVAEMRDTELVTHGDFFADDDGTFHENNINHVAEMGVAGGVGGGRYAPGRNMTRAQMATFLARLLDVVTGQRVADLPS